MLFFPPFFAAFLAIFGKMGLQNVDSTLATAVRAVIMAAFLIAAGFLSGSFSSFNDLNGKALQLIVLSGLAGAMSWLFYFLALKNGPATGVVALDRLSIIFVVIFALVFLGEKITWQSGLGAILIMIGAVLISF